MENIKFDNPKTLDCSMYFSVLDSKENVTLIENTIGQPDELPIKFYSCQSCFGTGKCSTCC